MSRDLPHPGRVRVAANEMATERGAGPGTARASAQRERTSPNRMRGRRGNEYLETPQAEMTAEVEPFGLDQVMRTRTSTATSGKICRR